MTLKEQVFQSLQGDWRTIFNNIEKQQQKGVNVLGLCPFHNDTNPSFSFHTETLQYHCFSCGSKGDAWTFLQDKEKLDFKEVLALYASKYNIAERQPEKKQELPDIKALTSNVFINTEVHNYLKDKRGLNDETIKLFEIGWDNKRGRNSIPIHNPEGTLINIKYHNSKKKVKTFSEVKGLEAQLYNVHRIKPTHKEIVICEGEFDCMLLWQYGFTAVTSTNGCQTFRPEWVDHFKGKDIVLLYDVDIAGRKAVESNVLPRFRQGSQSSIKNVKLPLSGTKTDNDITDYFLSGGTAEELQQLISSTSNHSYTNKADNLPPIELDSFIQVEDDQYVDKKVVCDITVCGETSESYHVPTRFKVTYCRQRDDKSACSTCPPDKDIELPASANEFIGSCGSPDMHVLSMLRRFACFQGQQPTIEITKKATVKEFFCSQAIAGEPQEPIEKKVYLLSSATIKPGKYRATGWIKTNPKNQAITFLIAEIVSQDDDFQKFRLEDNIKLLEQFKNIGFLEIINDVTEHVTNIYKVDELLTSMILTYCAPLQLHFNGEDIRGWINTFIVGDSSTGKSQTYKRLISFLGIGDVFQATTGSRTGLVYAVSSGKNGDWQIKIGKHPANDKKILIVDEANMIAAEEMRTLSAGMDEGYIEVNKVVSRTYKSRTRLIIISNAKNDQTMDTFTFGCTALKGLVSAPFIRRMDIGVFLNRDHVTARDYINKLNTSEHSRQLVTAEMLRAVIYWSWNLTKEQIIYSEDATKEILGAAETIMVPTYGFADDIPLVDRCDCRKTIARIAAAFAVLFISSDDYLTVIVKPVHVQVAVSFLDSVYKSESCQLDNYSDLKRQGSDTSGDVFEKLETLFLKKAEEKGFDASDCPDTYSTAIESNFVLVVRQIYQNDCITRSDLIIFSDVPQRTVDRVVSDLRKEKLVSSSKRGYRKEPKMIKFLHKFLKKHPKYLNIT